MSARKGYEMLDGAAKSSFNFEYFIVDYLCDLWTAAILEIKMEPLWQKSFLIFYIFVHIS